MSLGAMAGVGFVGGLAVGGKIKVSRGDVRCRSRRRRFARTVAVTSTSGSSAVEVVQGKDSEGSDSETGQLSIGERARTVVNTCLSGTMCTSSKRHSGAAFGSHVDYVIDEEGRPLFLLANSAAHTMNINYSPRVSLFCQPPSNSGQAGGRATLVGQISRVSRNDMPQLVESFVELHPHAKQALSYPDNFHFYRMDIDDVYFVGGYGVAADWVAVEDYQQATADPIANESNKLMDRLNTSGNDDVRRLCTVFCGMDDDQDFEAKVVSLDRLGLDLRITSESGTVEYRLCFREQIKNSFDAQSSLVKLLQESWERDNGYAEEWEGAPALRVIQYYSRERSKDSSTEAD